jgi:hypothetical protein
VGSQKLLSVTEATAGCTRKRTRLRPPRQRLSCDTRLFHPQFVEWLPRNADLPTKRFAPVTVLTI